MLPPTRLKLLRVMQRLTQAQLAAKAGISQLELSYAERGAETGGLSKIAAALGFPDAPERLLDRTLSAEVDKGEGVPSPPDMNLVIRAAAEEEKD